MTLYKSTVAIKYGVLNVHMCWPIWFDWEIEKTLNIWWAWYRTKYICISEFRNVFFQPPQEKVVEDLMETAAALSCKQMGYKRDYVEKAVRTYVNVNGKFNRAEAENKYV